MAAPSEKVPVTHLHAYLKQRSAQYMADRSSAKSHIYWSGPMQRWLKVTKVNPTTVKVEYHTVCPCAFS